MATPSQFLINKINFFQKLKLSSPLSGKRMSRNTGSTLIFTKKFKEKNKLIIPINQDNPYKLDIILPNLIYSYAHFPNLIYNYRLHKYMQETSNRKIQISNTLLKLVNRYYLCSTCYNCLKCCPHK